ncbi:MAG: ion transporter [Bacteroidetes bacterium]|nr:MAG: ion transporter [Bacteroidota bacterium]
MKLKERLYHVVFGTDTPAGRSFDVVLLWMIVISVLAVMLESVSHLREEYQFTFFVVEWVLTVLFTIEFFLRIWISPRPLKYLFSFWGVIDLLSILPTYMSLFFMGYHYLLIVRIFRLLRIFRILKLVRFNHEAQMLLTALRSSTYKITIFFFSVMAIVTFLGTIMYVVEGDEAGFTSIPRSIYWAIVTVTTVGYGDLVPATVIGKMISSLAMIIGYAIIAVPTGIVTVEMNRSVRGKKKQKQCTTCEQPCEPSAFYCSNCGTKLDA